MRYVAEVTERIAPNIFLIAFVGHADRIPECYLN